MKPQRTPFWELLCELEERSRREQDASSAAATSCNSADEASSKTRCVGQGGAMFGSYVEELAHRLDEVALAGLCRADMAARAAQLHGRQTSYVLALNCSGTAFVRSLHPVPVVPRVNSDKVQWSNRKKQVNDDAEEDLHDQHCVQLLVRATADPCARAS